MIKVFISSGYLKLVYLIGFTFLLQVPIYGQFKDRVWCFGDSSGIDFSNTSNPTTFGSNLRGRGSCTSICDSNSRLLFYAYTQGGLSITTKVIDSTHALMLNGDSIYGQGWYNELLVIPNINNISHFYLFSNVITSSGPQGLYYSIIDMSLNNGLGMVIQKNILISSLDFVDAMIGIRNGNGRDWWVILHTWNGTNTFYKYLITSNGINLVSSQNIGQVFNLDACKFCFSYASSKFMTVTVAGQIQLLDFDRCSGQFSNPIVIENPSIYSKLYCSCSISPNGNVGYVSNTNNIFGDSLTLYQYDLSAANISQSRQTIYKQPIPASGGLHAIGPDGKVYISCLDEFGFPYSDTLHTIYSDNISVINYPDSLGLSCDFQPFSFYLGGHRSYWGLPNNPNYEASAWPGSLCDTLTDVYETSLTEAGINVFYHPEYGMLFMNANDLKGKTYEMTIFDIGGNLIARDKGALLSGFYTKDIAFSTEKSGVYFIVIRTENQVLKQKFIKF